MSWRSKTYDELPALSVRGPQLRRSLRIVTMAWMYGIVWAVCITTFYVPQFGKALGITNFHFGLMGAIPFAATLTQLVAAVIIERTGLRKYQFVQFAVAHRLMWIPIAIAPLLLPWGSPLLVYTLLGLLLLSWLFESLGRPAWFTWMGDLIPRRIRGRYFAIRARITQAIQIVVVVLLGLLIDHDWGVLSWCAGLVGLSMPPATQMNLQRMIVYTICGVFAVGALFGARDILLFRRLRDVMPPRKASDVAVPGPRGFVPYLKYTLYDPLKDRVFRHFVGYAFTITLSAAISGIFYWRFCLVTLGYSLLATNMLFLVIGPLADMTSAPIWGRLIDRFGRRPVLLIATCGLSLSVLPWLIAQRGTPHPLFVEQAINFVCGQICSLFGQSWAGLDPSLPVGAYMLTTLGCIIGGTAWSGVNLAQMGLMLGIADSSGRSRAVAASGVLISIGGVVGGYCGGLLTQYIGEQTVLDWGPLLWVNFQATMVVTAALRVLAVGWLIGMPDPGAMPVRAVLVSLKGNFFNVLYSVAFQPLRILGLSRPAEFDRCGEKHGQNQKPPEQVDSSRDRGQDKG